MIGIACDDEVATSDQQNKEQKIIRIKEQWVHPPPTFDTLLYSYWEAYDSTGNMIEQKKYAIAGPLAYHTKIQYNQQGDEIFKSVYEAKSDSSKTYTSQIEYLDDRKHKIKVDSPEGPYHNIYSYNPDSSYMFTTFSKGQKIGEYHYNSDMKILRSYLIWNKHEELYEYNNKGDLTMRIRKKGDKVRDTIEYKLDYYKSGQLKETSTRGRKHVYTYNQNGDIKTETWYRNGELYRVVKYKYEYY